MRAANRGPAARSGKRRGQPAGRAADLLLACTLLLGACAPAGSEPRVNDAPPGQLRRDPANGTVVEWKGDNLCADLEASEDFRRVQQAGRPEEVALAFLDAHAPLLRLENPRQELRVRRAERDATGHAGVRLAQVYRGIEVWAADLVVTLDPANHVVRLAGRYQPTPAGLDLQPAISAAAARAAAEALSGRCNNCPPPLVIFFGRDAPLLAYHVDLVAGLAARWAVFVDARTGSVIHKTSMSPTGAIKAK